MAHVLVVDDDEPVLETFVRMLRTDGHEATAVAEPLEALRMAESQPPDAILLDLRMPVASGLDFLRALRAHPRFHALPVAVVTGDYFIKDAALKELEVLGAVIAYKPLWMADISALMHRLLSPAGPGASDAGVPS